MKQHDSSCTEMKQHERSWFTNRHHKYALSWTIMNRHESSIIIPFIRVEKTNEPWVGQMGHEYIWILKTFPSQKCTKTWQSLPNDLFCRRATMACSPWKLPFYWRIIPDIANKNHSTTVLGCFGQETSWFRWKRRKGKQSRSVKQDKNQTHTIDVWYIYLVHSS